MLGALPARNGVVKASLGRLLRVFEQFPVFGQIKNRFKIRSRGLYASLGVAFNHICRHQPALIVIIEVEAQLNNLAGRNPIGIGVPVVL